MRSRLKVFHHNPSVTFPFEDATRKVLSVHSHVGPFRPARRHFFRSHHTCICSFWSQRLFSKFSGHVFASHAINHGCLVVLASKLHQAVLHSSGCSLLIARSSQRENAQTSSDVHPRLGKFFLRCLGSNQSPLLLLP